MSKQLPLLIFLLTATIFSILYQGYHPIQSDLLVFSPYLAKLLNPGLFPKDFAIDAMVSNFPGLMWKLLVPISIFINPDSLLLFLHAFTRFLFYTSLFVVATVISGNKRIGYLTVLFWFIPKPSIAYDTLSNVFVQSQLATPLIVFSFVSFLYGRSLTSGLILGFVFYIHQPLALPAAAFVGLGFILTKQLGKLFNFTLMFLAVVSPLIPQIITVVFNSGSYDNQWLEIIRIRNSHHLFPSLWTIDQWLPTTLVFVMFLVAYFQERKNKVALSVTTVKVLLFGPTVVILLAIIFTELIPIRKVIMSAPFHIGNLSLVFPSIIIAMFLYRMVTSKDKGEKLLGFSLSYVFFFIQFSLKIQRAFLLFAIPTMLLVNRYKNNPRKLFVATVLLLIFWMPYLFYKNQIKLGKQTNDWVSVQVWARNNTPPNSVFIVPTYIDGFRMYSERSIFADWSDGALGLFHPSFIHEWWNRMELLGITKTKNNQTSRKIAYDNLDEIMIRTIKERYKVDFIVIDAGNNLSFVKIYNNKGYSIYHVE